MISLIDDSGKIVTVLSFITILSIDYCLRIYGFTAAIISDTIVVTAIATTVFIAIIMYWIVLNSCRLNGNKRIDFDVVLTVIVIILVTSICSCYDWIMLFCGVAWLDLFENKA